MGMHAYYSITRLGNGRALIIDVRSGLRSLFDTTTGTRLHGDVYLGPAAVLDLLKGN